MKFLHFLCTGLFLIAPGGFAAADTPPPDLLPFALALSVNDAASKTVYRGWPLILRGDAALMEDVTAPFALELASLTLKITPAGGSAVQWPLRRVTGMAAAPVLGPDKEAVRIVWLLTAAQSAGLVSGRYEVTLFWAGRESSPLNLIVVDPPAALGANDDARQAILRSEAALLLGDTAEALNVLEPVLARHPDSIDLLLQRARVHQERGEYQDALAATQSALKVFQRDFPQAEHPPGSILSIQSLVIAALVKALPANSPKITLVPAAASVAGPPPRPATPAAPKPPAKPIVMPGEADYTREPHGQWATGAEASSVYSATRWNASQATGAPNVTGYGDRPEAWASKTPDGAEEWLRLTFAQPVRASAVRVRQTFNPGAIVKVEAFAADGRSAVVWSGHDTTAYAKNQIAWFVDTFEPPPFPVQGIKLTLDSVAVKGFNEIDAVQLVGLP